MWWHKAFQAYWKHIDFYNREQEVIWLKDKFTYISTIGN